MPTLDIILITYNRKEHLARTLEQLFAEGSPVHRYGLTILNNASTDGSTDLINAYVERYPTLLKHILHPRNIGGNANIARAFELATAEYVWVLCDDDEFDFTHWHTVEEALAEGVDAVVVANYVNPKKNLAQLACQLTFVPAAIYKTDLLDTTTLVNMYFNVAMMFPHFALCATLLNKNKTIHIVDNWMVRMIPHADETSYVRGLDVYRTPLLSNMFWQVGFSNALQQIQCPEKQRQILECLTFENENSSVFGGQNLIDGNDLVGRGSLWNLLTLYANLACSKRLQRELMNAFFLTHVCRLRFHQDEVTTKLEVNHVKIKFWDNRWIGIRSFGFHQDAIATKVSINNITFKLWDNRWIGIRPTSKQTTSKDA
ncbi:MAG: glycosyltransferase family 2 protein [Vampirovibrionales bacterium]